MRICLLGLRECESCPLSSLFLPVLWFGVTCVGGGTGGNKLKWAFEVLTWRFASLIVISVFALCLGHPGLVFNRVAKNDAERSESGESGTAMADVQPAK
jgi:hypothetical protein